MPAGSYLVDVRAAGTSTAVLDDAKVSLDPGTNTIIYAIGSLSDGTFTVDRRRCSRFVRSDFASPAEALAEAGDAASTGRVSGAARVPSYRHGHRPREADARRPRGRAGPSGGRPTAPTASTGPPPATEVFSIDTPPPTVSRARCTSATSSATPTPTPSPATSACGASTSSTRWAGTTTACPPSAGSRTTSASAATRRCPTTRTSSRPTSPAEAPGARSAGRNFVELCRAAHRRRRAGLRGRCCAGSACRVDWRLPTTRRSTSAAAGLSQRRLPAQPGPGRGLPARGADAVGRRLPHRGRPGRAGGPGDARRLPPARLPPRRRRRRPRDRHDPARAARRAAWPWSPTPTTSATSRCSARRCARRCSASRCRSSPTSWPTPRRAPASP